MGKVIKLTADLTASYSGNTYFEEIFLPKSVWVEIKDNFEHTISIMELDGKHSCVEDKVKVTEMTKEDIMGYQLKEDDGESLFYQVCEAMPVEDADELLLKYQNEICNLSEVDTMTIKFKDSDKQTILDLIDQYLI